MVFSANIHRLRQITRPCGATLFAKEGQDRAYQPLPPTYPLVKGVSSADGGGFVFGRLNANRTGGNDSCITVVCNLCRKTAGFSGGFCDALLMGILPVNRQEVLPVLVLS